MPHNLHRWCIICFIWLFCPASVTAVIDDDPVFVVIPKKSREQLAAEQEESEARKLAEFAALQQQVDAANAERRPDREAERRLFYMADTLGYSDSDFHHFAIGLAETLLTTSTLSTAEDRKMAGRQIQLLASRLPPSLSSAQLVEEKAAQYMRHPAAKEDSALVYEMRDHVEHAYLRAGDIQTYLKMNIATYRETSQLLSSYMVGGKAGSEAERERREAVGEARRMARVKIEHSIRQYSTRRDVRYLLECRDVWEHNQYLYKALLERGFIVVDTAEWNRRRAQYPDASVVYMPAPEGS